MGQKRQAKILSRSQQDIVLRFLETTRFPLRNKLIFLLSVRAGLRAKEIAHLSWEMVLDAEGQVCDCITLHDKASKGKSGGVIWLNNELKAALKEFSLTNPDKDVLAPVLLSERKHPFKPQIIVNMFYLWYAELEFKGCSSHSGRRTFITNAARKISTVGGSIRDVQMLARHSSLAMTQKYIEAEVDAQKRVVQLI